MDQKLQAEPAHNGEHIETIDGLDPSTRPRKPGRRQKKRVTTPEPVGLLFKTAKHFLRGFSSKINSTADPRREEQCIYTQAHLIWTGILLFMMHLGSRRQMRFERLTDEFERNMEKLSGQRDLETVADPDTLAYYAERVPLPQIEKLLAWITVRLIRMKVLDPFRLYGHFTVAIDGSQICTFDSEPWPDCPHRQLSNGTTQYFAYVLDAKLVTPCGMALSLATEMLTNEGNEQFDKQDCEQKAFPRLVAKLRKLFPRTPFCLLLDGLYANQNAIRLIGSHNWKYIITFKEGSMPERYREANVLLGLHKHNRRRALTDKATQLLQWVDQLPIAEFNPAILFCRHKPKGKKATLFAWLTNFKLHQENVDNIANKGGRLRWKIENEGFNVQKNDGYEMKHPYSEHQNGFRVFYVILLIAHYITQLILHGSLIRSLAESFGSAKNFARRLAESLRNYILPEQIQLPGQIRFLPP